MLGIIYTSIHGFFLSIQHAWWLNKTWFTHRQWMYTTDTDYCKTVDPSYVLACLSEGAAGSSFLVGTTLSCSLCSGSHDIQSGSRDCSRNFSLETALSKTATSEKPNIEPAQNEARITVTPLWSEWGSYTCALNEGEKPNAGCLASHSDSWHPCLWI